MADMFRLLHGRTYLQSRLAGDFLKRASDGGVETWNAHLIQIPTRPSDRIKGNIAGIVPPAPILRNCVLAMKQDWCLEWAGVNDKMCGAEALARENFGDTRTQASKIAHEGTKSLASEAKRG